jgi:hypothetical protein
MMAGNTWKNNTQGRSEGGYWRLWFSAPSPNQKELLTALPSWLRMPWKIRKFFSSFENFWHPPNIHDTILDKTLEIIPANVTKLLNIGKTNFVSPSPQFNVVNNAETTFGNIPWHKLDIELGERGLKFAGAGAQHGVYHKNMRIFYRGKIVSTSYVQDCLNVRILHACQLFESYG